MGKDKPDKARKSRLTKRVWAVAAVIGLGLAGLGLYRVSYTSSGNLVPPLPEASERSLGVPPDTTPNPTKPKDDLVYERVDPNTETPGPPFYRLVARSGDRAYVVIDEKEEICFYDLYPKDFDEDGYSDVLIRMNGGCGGNCCLDEYFFVSHRGNGRFSRSKPFGYAYKEPKIERHRGRWSVVVEVRNEGFNTDDPIDVRERYVLEDGNAVLVEKSELKPLLALAEMKSEELSDLTAAEERSLRYDLDGDGTDDQIIGSFWARWGRISWRVQFSSGLSFDDNRACKRIGVLASRSQGVHDLVCDLATVYRWDGKTYVRQEPEP
ncbi:hypothetical protein [Calidithermus chliarophilus]|uniref:hypothetical protein n=1 Tax=Calidithermus chliarophilus TaxID=52023 RepID=UPI0012F6ADB7|nr:hypothetical protein [Calidithermus chliarophilus]